MLLCPVPAHEISPPGTDGRAADAGKRARHVHEAERSLLEAVRRLKLRQEAAAGPLDAPRPVGPDVADAVVLDLDAARRARQERTL
jgi:hypothetical protein